MASAEPRVTTATMAEPMARVEEMLELKNIMMIFLADSTQKMHATSAAKVSSVNLVKKRTRLEDDVTATNIRMIDVQMPVQA
jgi:hypothetical protein